MALSIRFVKASINFSRSKTISGNFFSGGLKQSPTPDSLATGMIKATRTFTKESGVELCFNPPEKKLPEIVFDREKFILALTNLIDNAIHYGKHPGARVDIRAYAEGEFVRVDVRDNGIGIAESYMPKLFSKFSRAPNAIREYTEGSGLGLFIVKNIIKRHGGDVMVKSEEGKGSIFSMLLPLDPNKIPQVSEVYEEN